MTLELSLGSDRREWLIKDLSSTALASCAWPVLDLLPNLKVFLNTIELRVSWDVSPEAGRMIT